MHRTCHAFVRAAGLLALMLLPSTGRAAYDAFLKIEGVEGEATDSVYVGWAQVRSFRTGLNPPAAETSARPWPLHLVKSLDRTSPLLARACATGAVLPQVKLDLLRRTRDTRVRFYRIELADVVVVRTAMSATTAETSGLPVEQIELAAARWSWRYTEFELDGRRLHDLETMWDSASQTGDGRTLPALRMSGTAQTDGLTTLSFPTRTGSVYRVLAGPDLGEEFEEVWRSEATPEDGDTVLELPTTAHRRFFVVEELP